MSVQVRTSVPTPTSRVKFRKQRPACPTPAPENPPARIPRIARLLALAHRIEGMIRSGELKNWAEAARLIGVTSARMTQIAGLRILAPRIQEVLLGKQAQATAQDPLTEHCLRNMISKSIWIEQ